MIDILQSGIDILAALLSALASVFPTSPFKTLEAVTVDNELLAVLAWLVPFPQIMALLEAWGISIAIYYCWMVIARWAKFLS